jgi:tight adherence protein B
MTYDYFFRYRLAVRKRVSQLYDREDAHQVSIFKDEGQFDGSVDAGRNRRFDYFSRLKELFSDEVPFATLAARSVAGGFAGGLLGVLVRWQLALICVPLGLLCPAAILIGRRHRRRRKLGRQLPEAFQMISRAVRAGQTIPAALQIIAQDFESPVSEEFARCCEQQNLGVSRETAFRDLARRSGIMELQIFVVALLVQAKCGGDLVELLDNLANMIRKRFKLKERVRALTGEGRMQAIVLTVLPIAAFFGVRVLSPDYVTCLMERPWILVATACSQLLGMLWIRRIISFEY